MVKHLLLLSAWAHCSAAGGWSINNIIKAGSLCAFPTDSFIVPTVRRVGEAKICVSFSSWVKQTGSQFPPSYLSDIAAKAMCPFSGFPESLQREHPLATGSRARGLHKRM